MDMLGQVPASWPGQGKDFINYGISFVEIGAEQKVCIQKSVPATLQGVKASGNCQPVDLQPFQFKLTKTNKLDFKFLYHFNGKERKKGKKKRQ